MRRIEVGERRARLAIRHHLAPAARASDPVQVARDLVGLHATDPVTVYLSARARSGALEPAGLERALYEDRTLLKILGMRRTMFVVPVELAGIIEAACSQEIGVRERQRVIAILGQAGVDPDPERWLAEVEAATVAALDRRGEATAVELSREVPGLRVQIPFGEGKRWAGTFGVSTRLLLLLAAEGRVIRARPRGSWTSSLYRWAPMGRWVPGGLPAWPTEAARTELVRRWLAAFGPGTQQDLRWWTGWPLARVRAALAQVGAVGVDLEGEAGFVLPNDVEPAPPVGPWVALLPGLDATVMGWSGRRWFLGEHGLALFDRNGNAGPTAWCDGRVVGGWSQRADGTIVVRLLEDVGREAAEALGAEAAGLEAWLGAVRVTPRFRTPLEQELTGGQGPGTR